MVLLRGVVIDDYVKTFWRTIQKLDRWHVFLIVLELSFFKLCIYFIRNLITLIVFSRRYLVIYLLGRAIGIVINWARHFVALSLIKTCFKGILGHRLYFHLSRPAERQEHVHVLMCAIISGVRLQGLFASGVAPRQHVSLIKYFFNHKLLCRVRHIFNLNGGHSLGRWDALFG